LFLHGIFEYFHKVRCEPEESGVLNAAFLEDGTGGSLPSKIVRRARFTLAHEIAHTLFFDIKASPPRSKVLLDDDGMHAKLELVCNQIAGLLVLPESLIPRSLVESPAIQPRDLRKLADSAMVSGQTVIRRFNGLRKISHPEAVIATVARSHEDWTITAISRHYALKEVFKTAIVGDSVRCLVQEPDFVLFGGKMRDVRSGYIGHGGRRKEMQFSCEFGSRLRRAHEVIVVGVPVTE